jgi:hypothetical protein
MTATRSTRFTVVRRRKPPDDRRGTRIHLSLESGLCIGSIGDLAEGGGDAVD